MRKGQTSVKANTKNPLRIHCAKVCTSSLMRKERLPMYVSKQTFDPRHVSSQFLFAALADCFSCVRVCDLARRLNFLCGDGSVNGPAIAEITPATANGAIIITARPAAREIGKSFFTQNRKCF
jgi:hypothetical protein